MIALKRKEIALKVAWHFVGLPYRWGGDDPMAGFDCSGFILEILKSVGLMKRSMDLTADGIYRHFTKLGCPPLTTAEICRLAFWKDPGKKRIRHVEFLIGPAYTIGASGGGSNTKNEAVAIRRNAFIKVRPLDLSDVSLFSFVDPFRLPSNYWQ